MTIEEFSIAIRDRVGANSTSGRKLPGRDEYLLEWIFENPRYLAGLNIREDMLENVHDMFIDATAEQILKNYRRHTNPQYPDDLPNGASHYDGANTVYYRGDGIYTTVNIPEGKTVERVSPPQFIVEHPEPDVLAFRHAIRVGELVTITLRDAE